jgi:hypothetical protein
VYVCVSVHAWMQSARLIFMCKMLPYFLIFPSFLSVFFSGLGFDVDSIFIRKMPCRKVKSNI